MPITTKSLMSNTPLFATRLRVSSSRIRENSDLDATLRNLTTSTTRNSGHSKKNQRRSPMRLPTTFVVFSSMSQMIAVNTSIRCQNKAASHQDFVKIQSPHSDIGTKSLSDKLSSTAVPRKSEHGYSEPHVLCRILKNRV